MSPFRRRGNRGQALVEFSLTVMIFLFLLMGIFDFGRAIFMYNGVSQAAREIARVTSVHPGSPLGGSTETAAVVSTQKNLIPNLGDPTYRCVAIDNTDVTGVCKSQQHAVKVTISAVYTPVTPILSFLGDITLSSSSSAKIQPIPWTSP